MIFLLQNFANLHFSWYVIRIELPTIKPCIVCITLNQVMLKFKQAVV